MDNKLVEKGKYIYNEIQARDKTKLMIKNLEQNLRVGKRNTKHFGNGICTFW